MATRIGLLLRSAPWAWLTMTSKKAEKLPRSVPAPIGPSIVMDLIRTGRLTEQEMVDLALLKTNMRDRGSTTPPSPDDADRLRRLSRVIAEAEATFGSQRKAAAWLRRPAQPLGNQRPLVLSVTEPGMREVEALLEKINHGLAV